MTSYYHEENKMRKDRDRITSSDLLFVFIILVILVLLITYLSYPINKVINEHTIVTTITEKKVNDIGIYIISTRDNNDDVYEFEISNSILKFRFNSVDIYDALEKGKTYELTVCGYKNELLYLYPNIYEYKEIKEEE